MPGFELSDAVARPALVLTSHVAFGAHSGGSLVAMITSAKNSDWPFDVAITDLTSAGLKMPCLVRAKLNAVDLALIARKIGTLEAEDRRGVNAPLRGVLAGGLG